VALVGDFNGWDRTATPLRPAGSAGAWVVSVQLPPGRYRYAFLIDGVRWLPDPVAPRAPDDDFGTSNSVLMVGL
jgi:1,4-alpha-glucan branching enzyme